MPKIMIISPAGNWSRQFEASLVAKGANSVFCSNDKNEIKAQMSHSTDIIVLNMSLEDGWSFDLLNGLRAQYDQMPIYLTSQDLHLNDCAVKESGVRGFVANKNSAELIERIHSSLDSKCKVS